MRKLVVALAGICLVVVSHQSVAGHLTLSSVVDASRNLVDILCDWSIDDGNAGTLDVIITDNLQLVHDESGWFGAYTDQYFGAAPPAPAVPLRTFVLGPNRSGDPDSYYTEGFPAGRLDVELSLNVYHIQAPSSGCLAGDWFACALDADQRGVRELLSGSTSFMVPQAVVEPGSAALLALGLAALVVGRYRYGRGS